MIDKMGSDSDAAAALLLGVLGGAVAAFLLGLSLDKRKACPHCGNVVINKDSKEFITCSKCGNRLRWKP